MRKSLTTAALVALATGTIIVGVAGPAAATNSTPAPECETTTTTTLGDGHTRADDGLNGVWAMDEIVRTVKICQDAPEEDAPDVAPLSEVEIARWRKVSYTATVTDTGSFVTVDGKSPVAGEPLKAGTKGSLIGTYTDKFKAKPNFWNYKGKRTFDGKKYTGAEPAKTTEFVQKLWGGKDFELTDSLGMWTWTYWTCSDKLDKATESWTNAHPDVNKGDITGKPCPTPTATTPAATATASTPAGGAAGGLPVTGSNTGILAGVAVVLLASGAGLFLVGRRRRSFTA